MDELDSGEDMENCQNTSPATRAIEDFISTKDTRQLIQKMLEQPSLVESMSANLEEVEDDLRDEVTVITGYINIGEFQKGSNSRYTPSKYYDWMKVFGKIKNPLVAFVENEHDRDVFLELRSEFPANLTKMYVIARDELWAFVRLKPKIAKLYADPKYPKHHPNTVIADYSCIMHAKYEMMLRSVLNNPFHTRYVAWLDIGLFRNIAQATETFSLYLPPSFDLNKVAYQRLYDRKQLDAKTIFYNNKVWVGGGFFISRTPVMMKWTMEYMKYAQYYLEQDLMNTDQQILYSMFSTQKPAIEIQEYSPKSGDDPWFSLGYLCREEGKKRKGIH